MPPGKGFSNPIVFEDNFQGWRKILVARSEGCKQRTDPYLFSPDKTKLRYRLSFVIFHWSKSRVKSVSWSSFPISTLFHSHSGYCLVHIPINVYVPDVAGFTLWMLPCSCPGIWMLILILLLFTLLMLLCSCTWRCHVYIPNLLCSRL